MSTLDSGSLRRTRSSIARESSISWLCRRMAMPVLIAAGLVCGGAETAFATSALAFSKLFGASSIPVGGSTTLSFSITNLEVSTFLTHVTFTDPLPNGLIVSTPNGLSGSCGSGGAIITAPAGGTSISLSDGTLPPEGGCYFQVNVTATNTGAKVNTTSSITSDQVTGNPAMATINVPFITEYPVTTSDAGPEGIAAGPDGALWFTEYNGNKIGRITTTGGITEFPVPTADCLCEGIVAGPDGNVWFTEADKIGRITPGGTITEYTVPTSNPGVQGITAGPDGALWFTENLTDKIG